MMANLMWTLHFLVAIFPLYIEGIESFCTAPSVKAGETGTISCLFTKDLSRIPPKDVNIYMYKDMKIETYPQLILSYQWVNGSPRITVRPGYICTGNLTDYLEITIYNIKEEHAGSYKCVSPSIHRAISCKLYVYEEKSNNARLISTTVTSVEVNKGIESVCMASSVTEGETGIISCQFTQDLSITSSKYLRVYMYRGSDPEPNTVLLYSWDADSSHMYTMPGYKSKGNLTDHFEIAVYNVTKEHSGIYMCIVGPSTIRTAKPCTLYVNEGIESFCIAPHISIGETGTISCRFSKDLSITPQQDLRLYLFKDAVFSYSWINGSSRIEANTGYKVIGNLTDHLEIAVYNATKKQAGLYKCAVVPPGKHQANPCTLHVSEGIESFCTANTVSAGNKAIISCRFTEDLSIAPRKDLRVYLYKDTVLSYSWVNGSSLIETRRGYMCKGNLTDHLDITIYNVSKEHAGLYKCMVVPPEKNKANTCTLHVNEGIKSFCIAPSVSVGDTGIISCRFTEDLSNAPQKDIRVYLYEDAVFNYSWVNGSSHTEARPAYKNIGNLTDHMEIAINNVTKEHAGRYTCIAFSSTDQQATSCTLYVNGGNRAIPHTHTHTHTHTTYIFRDRERVGDKYRISHLVYCSVGGYGGLIIGGTGFHDGI